MLFSEIRESTKLQLLEKVRKNDYGQYLFKASIVKIRGFTGEDITFEFPVTALIGPNGSGKSSVLGMAGCAYKSVRPGMFFPKSAVGDESMSGWRVEYELVDKTLNPRQLIKRTSNFRQAKWVRADVADRNVLFFGIERTVPAGEKTRYKQLMRSTYVHKPPLQPLDANVATQVEHILGKSVAEYKVTRYGSDDTFLVGRAGGNQYSEFHFGAGESSIIRMISTIENAPTNSLILIEEIENGLHPVATRRMVEYLIDVAERKSIQTIFTTHSDYALSPLPSEAIWASIDGKLKQGKLSVEALRAVSGRVDKQLAVFVEDEFAKSWVDTILRESLGANYDQVEVHAVHGDGNAVATHRVSPTAVMEPPMFGVMEPQTVAKTTPRGGLNNGGFCLFFGDGFARLWQQLRCPVGLPIKFEAISVVAQSVQRGRTQQTVHCKRLIPLCKVQITGHHRRGALITLRDQVV